MKCTEIKISGDGKIDEIISTTYRNKAHTINLINDIRYLSFNEVNKRMEYQIYIEKRREKISGKYYCEGLLAGTFHLLLPFS